MLSLKTVGVMTWKIEGIKAILSSESAPKICFHLSSGKISFKIALSSLQDTYQVRACGRDV